MLEETVEAGRLVPHEQVQQRSVGKMAKYRRQQAKTDVCSLQWKQYFDVFVEVDKCPSGVIEVPETASQDWRLQRTVVQYLDVSVEVNKNVFQERIF